MSKKSAKGVSKRISSKSPLAKPKSRSTASQADKKAQKKILKPGRVGKWKPRTYSEAELNIPELNMITPAGVQKPKGKKKGKVFVDDQTSMMTILAMVNAEKEGQIESKMMKERQMEEIREARRQEIEKRAENSKSKLSGQERTKDRVRRKAERKSHTLSKPEKPTDAHKSKKTVSFA